MAAIKKYCSFESLYDKKVLELGCGYADIGHRFHLMGSRVTSSDARIEHLVQAKQRYPHLNYLQLDMDVEIIPDNYDVIVHWGLLYHLKEIENHLLKLSKNCNVLFLETEVSDSDDPNFFITTNENGFDQAFHGNGIRPSPAYVENVLQKCGFQYKLIIDPILDCWGHKYTLPIQNTKTWNHGFRRFWICWKDPHCPLLNKE